LKEKIHTGIRLEKFVAHMLYIGCLDSLEFYVLKSQILVIVGL